VPVRRDDDAIALDVEDRSQEPGDDGVIIDDEDRRLARLTCCSR
jgi:hypothetical protein